MGQTILDRVRSIFSGGSPADQQPTPDSRAPGHLPDEWANTLVQFVNDEFKRRQQERKPWELQWRLNEEFVNDNQYTEIHAGAASLTEVPKLYWWQEREPFNHIAPIIETRIARLCRVRPKATVSPASGNVDDIAAASFSKDLIDYYHITQDMDEKIVELVHWMEVHGCAFLEPVWDPRAGRLLQRITADVPDETVQALTGARDRPPENAREPSMSRLASVFNPNGQVLQELYEGDIATNVVPATEVWPDSPWRKGMDDVRSIIRAKAYHVDDIYEQWGVKVEGEEVTATTRVSVTAGTGGLGYGAGGYRFTTRKLKDHAVVKHYMERPTRRYPDGRYIIVAGDKCLHAGPLPFEIGDDGRRDIPLFQFASIKRQGCFWPKSPVERLIPVQRRYNALRNRVAEYLNRVAIGGWYDEEAGGGSNKPRDNEHLDPAPGMVVPRRPGSDLPKPIDWPTLPREFQQEFENLMREFTVLSGIGEVARFSEAPPGVKSGVALAITLEQDDTRLSTPANGLARGLAKVGQCWLRLAKQFVQEPRLLLLAGDMDLPNVRYWTAADIRADKSAACWIHRHSAGRWCSACSTRACSTTRRPVHSPASAWPRFSSSWTCQTTTPVPTTRTCCTEAAHAGTCT